MKKIILIALLLPIAVMVGITACSNQRVKVPSICEKKSPKVSDLKAWSFNTYGVNTVNTKMLLCEIANERDIHLEATGDLLMVLDSVAIRSKAYTRDQAIIVFTELRDTFLSAARGEVTILFGDLYSIAAYYAGSYPELGILLQYTDIFRLPDWEGRFPTVLDFMALTWWCDQNLNLLARID